MTCSPLQKQLKNLIKSAIIKTNFLGIEVRPSVLKSDEIKDFINEKYDGAVIPFEDSDDAEAEDTEAADAEADTADEAAEETDAE